jgi:HPt (histidine-containing phosphotransfer) domain-containing protein
MVENDNIEMTVVFDKNDVLDRLMGDEELLEMLLDGFFIDVPERIQELKKSLNSGDISTVERQAHTIKGASASVGGTALRNVAYEMEKAAKVGNLIEAAGHMPELERRFDQLRIVVKGNNI